MRADRWRRADFGHGDRREGIDPDIEMIGVEAELYPSMKNVVEGGARPIGGDTLAEGIAVKEPGLLTRTIIKDLVSEILLVPERKIERAVALLVAIEKDRRRRRGRGRAWRRC